MFFFSVKYFYYISVLIFFRVKYKVAFNVALKQSDLGCASKFLSIFHFFHICQEYSLFKKVTLKNWKFFIRLPSPNILLKVISISYFPPYFFEWIEIDFESFAYKIEVKKMRRIYYLLFSGKKWNKQDKFNDVN